MDSYSPFSNTQIREHEGGELYLKIGTSTVFGVSFLNMAEARKAARQINVTGRDISITVVIIHLRNALISESMGHHDSEIADDGFID